MEDQTLLNTASRIGYMLLENGAETYRVEDSVTHVLRAYGIKDINVFAIPSCVIVSITTNKQIPLTKSKRVINRTQNLDRIIKLNSLCRKITATQPTLADVNEQLDQINGEPTYSFFTNVLANCIGAAAFTLFFGGAVLDSICAFLIGAIVLYHTSLMNKFKMNSFTTTTLNSFIITIIAVCLTRFSFGLQYDKIIIGCYMLLVPGVAITNAARDFIAGDLLSGTIRLSEAFLVATSIALGSGIALSIIR